MKHNFDMGLAQSKDTQGNYIGLPIDFGHESWGKAGAWIKALELEDDILWASVVEYTDAGRQALQSGEYKCISPSFYPSCLGWWYDHEDPSISAQNVLVGAGFTNIPFFKDLVAIMASTTTNDKSGSSNIIYVKADVNNKGEKQMPEFEDVRKKIAAGAEYTNEEKQVLADNRDKLTADELVLAGMQDDKKPINNEGNKPVDANNKPQGVQITADQQQVLADIASGKKVLVEADKYNELESKVDASAQQLKDIKRAEISKVVEAAVADGRIKQDKTEFWVDKIEADDSMKEVLENMNKNPEVTATEKGKDGIEGSASSVFDSKVEAAIKESKEKGQEMSYSDAVKQVATDDPELSKQREVELHTA